MGDVLAAKDCKCSASLSLHTQQRRSWPPVAMIDELSAMQLMGAGEATHSCWRAAMFLLWGSLLDLRGLRGRAPPRYGLAAATQQHPQGARRTRTVGAPINFELPSVYIDTLAPGQSRAPLPRSFHRVQAAKIIDKVLSVDAAASANLLLVRIQT